MSEAQNVPKPGPQRLRVLLADDSRIIRVAVRRILADSVDLVEAKDGEEAWQVLSESDEFDVLLTDLSMPKLDGYQLIERVRDPQNPRHLRNLPIVVLSGADEPEEKQRALDAGASDYVTKPFNTQQISERIAALAREAARHRDDVGAPGSASDPGAMDPRTRLANRALFEQQAERDLAFAKRHGKDLSLMLVCVDAPQALVERHGVQLTEQLVRKLGEFLGQCVRRPDTVGRIGRYQFGVLAPMTNDLGAVVVANRILSRIRAVRFNTARGSLSFTVSLGLAAPSAHLLENVESLKEIALRRLRLAVKAGGDRAIYDDHRPQAAADASPAAAQDGSADEAAAAAAAGDVGGAAKEGLAEPAVGGDGAGDNGAGEESRPSQSGTDAASAAAMPAELQSATSAAPQPATAGQLPEALEVALWLVADGQSQRLAGHHRHLLQRVMPLIEAIDADEELELGDALQGLRAALRLPAA